jgi:hypothetical protein
VAKKSASPASGREALQRVSLQQSDVRSGNRVRLYPDGDTVKDEVSLDLCNADFASEVDRVLRHQVGIDTGTDVAPGVSTEAIMYNSSTAAATATSELQAARTQCPRKPVPSPVADTPPSTFTFGPPPDHAWASTPSVQREAFDVTDQSTDGTDHSDAIYLRRGALLVAIYYTLPDAGHQLAPSVSTAQQLTAAIEHRIAALPPRCSPGLWRRLVPTPLRVFDFDQYAGTNVLAEYI